MATAKPFINLQGRIVSKNKIVVATIRRSIFWWSNTYILELLFPAKARFFRGFSNEIVRIKYKSYKAVDKDRVVLEKADIRVRDRVFG